MCITGLPQDLIPVWTCYKTPHLKGVYNANWSDAIWLFSVRRSSDSTLSESEEAHFCHLILSAIYCLWPGEGKTNQV